MAAGLMDAPVAARLPQDAQRAAPGAPPSRAPRHAEHAEPDRVFITNHALAGAAIGLVGAPPRPRPSSLGLASHLGMDMVPALGRRGPRLGRLRRGRPGRRHHRPGGVRRARWPPRPGDARPAVAAGIAGACLIDMDKPGRHFFGRSPFPAAVDRFHGRIQNERPIGGLVEAAVAARPRRRAALPRARRRRAPRARASASDRSAQLATVPRTTSPGGHHMAAIDARDTLEAGGERYEIHRLSALDDDFDVGRLPYSMKVLLENLLRHNDGVRGHRRRRGRRGAGGTGGRADGGEREISFLPARVLMQDFTGVPAVVDLAAMRHAVAERGGDPAGLDPLIPADLVIDHSVQVDVFGRPEALARNAELEYERNLERYQFLRWGQQAFGQFSVVPPATGICHQVNLEYLATVVATRDGVAFPDTLVGTDSHTPMVNGLGVVGLGRGRHRGRGRAAGPAHLDAHPQVVGFKLSGELPEGTTATDLVLTVTNMLRATGWSAGSSSSTGRAWPTCRSRTGRRSATCRPSTARRSRSSPSTTRPCATCASPAGPTPGWRSSRPTPRSRACGTTRRAEPTFTETLELDLSHRRALHRRAGPAPGPGAAARGQGRASPSPWLDSLPEGAAPAPASGRRCRSATATTTPTPSRSRPATRPPPPRDGAEPTSAPARGRPTGGPGDGADRPHQRVAGPPRRHVRASTRRSRSRSTTATSPSPPSPAAPTRRTRR